MKRFIAAIIDIVLFYIFNALVVMLLLACILNSGLYIFIDLIFNFYMVIMIIILFAYFFISDYKFSELTVGKKIMNIKPYQYVDKIKFEYAYVHTLIKITASILWPITIIYFLTHNNTMFYDTILKIEIEN